MLFILLLFLSFYDECDPKRVDRSVLFLVECNTKKDLKSVFQHGRDN